MATLAENMNEVRDQVTRLQTDDAWTDFLDEVRELCGPAADISAKQWNDSDETGQLALLTSMHAAFMDNVLAEKSSRDFWGMLLSQAHVPVLRDPRSGAIMFAYSVSTLRSISRVAMHWCMLFVASILY